MLAISFCKCQEVTLVIRHQRQVSLRSTFNITAPYEYEPILRDDRAEEEGKK